MIVTARHPARVLVVDDNPDVAEMQAILLRLCGQLVRTAHGGREALRVASHFRPDFVFIDLVMPDIDGTELARQLRELAQTRSAKLIAITGFSGERVRQAITSNRFDDHLTKPACAADFLRALRCA